MMMVMTNVYYNKITFQQNNKSQVIDLFTDTVRVRVRLGLGLGLGCLGA